MSPGDRKGILAMVTAMTLFAASDAIMKLGTELIPAGQLLFVRAFPLTAGLAVFAWRMGAFASPLALFEPHNLARGALEGASAFLYIAALAHIPLALGSAINMSTPLIALPIAALVLGERFGPRRVAAILVGFAGVMLILRPGAGGVDFWLAMSLLSAALCAMRDVVTRMIPARVPTALVTLTTVACVGAVGGIVAFFEGWVPMPGAIWAHIFASAAIAGTGMHFIVMAMRLGQVSVVGPFRYSALIGATLVGWIVWGHLPDALAWTGIAMIVGAGIYALWRESKVAA